MAAPQFCFTLDTEPDDLWTVRDTLSFDHFALLYDFHLELTARGARPVYLTTSEVVEDPGARQTMRRILDTGQAEIGAHYHSWTRAWPFPTPALGQPPLQAMAHRLGAPFEERMLAFTNEAIARHLSTRPISYRGGRWSLGPGSVAALVNCGIEIDTTVTPGRTWTDPSERLTDGPDYREFPTHPFYLQPGSLAPQATGPLLELPVGAAHAPPRGPRTWPGRLRRALRRGRGVRSKPGWVWLRPTSMTTPQLQACLEGLARDAAPVWVAMIHSSEIVPCGQFATAAEVAAFKQRCFRLVEAAQELGARCATLAEARSAYVRS